MAELKRTFSKAKMNKDSDERLVKTGEYRDALNIEISTSEGGNVGTAQNIKGNTKRNTMLSAAGVYDVPDTATCVGSIAALNTDKVYYLVSAGDSNTNLVSAPSIKKDYIIEYDTVAEKHRYVFVDIYQVNTACSFDTVSSNNYLLVPSVSTDNNIVNGFQLGEIKNTSGIRIGMKMTSWNGYGIGDDVQVTDIQIIDNVSEGVTTNYWKIILNKNLSAYDITATTNVTFYAPNQERVLDFDKSRFITGINILDDFLFWTDNHSEPKRINIKRSIAGTGGISYLYGASNLGYGSGSPTSNTFIGDNPWFHTRLVKGSVGNFSVVTKAGGTKAAYTEKKHVTVIKKGPTQPLELTMYSSSVPRIPTGSTSANASHGYISSLNLFEWVTFGLPFAVGDQLAPLNADIDTTGTTTGNTVDSNTITLQVINTLVVPGVQVTGDGIPDDETPFVISVDGVNITLSTPQTIATNTVLAFIGNVHVPGTGLVFTEPKDFRVGDILRLTPAESDTNFSASDSYALRVKILQSDDGQGPSGNPNELQSTYKAVILSIRGNLTPVQKSFKVALEEGDSLFEFKFPRFSYRYKYTDGEYSTFAPWSRVAFLADTYSFSPSQGYNLGMANKLRQLTLKGYHTGEDRMMEDVTEIDILYKETNNPTVYTVTTITPQDSTPGLWPIPGELDGEHEQRGLITISTDLIHAVVPSNQLLRPWDNVPRKALAQEISANRLIYGNYLQGYNVPILPVVNAGLNSLSLSAESGVISSSVKTLRDYTVGVVFGDGYGRETPVLFSGDSANGVRVPKSASHLKNSISAQLSVTTDVPSWAKYFSYYIKEPTTEYYNLIMDRWYNADDGNLWLSFPSSERNKLQNEDFLVLKKANGGNIAATGAAKYKVIAIENEAPDFIRTIHRPIGTIFDEGTDNPTIGALGEGFPLQDLNSFTVTRSAVVEALGDDFSTNTPNLSVSFSGGEASTKKYTVTKIVWGGLTGGSQNYIFHIAGKFEADIGFATNYTDLITNRIDFMVLRIFKTEKENRPEFQGRFFVKINRDPDIEKYILGSSSLSDVSVSLSHKVLYLNNNWYKNSAGQGQLMPDDPRAIRNPNIGIYVDGEWVSEDITSELRSVHPTEYQYHFNQGGTNVTRYYWGLKTGASAETDVESELGGVDYTGSWTSFFNQNPIKALNDSFSGSGAAAVVWRKIWETGAFFIDGASAYTFTSFSGFDGWDGQGDGGVNAGYPLGSKTGAFGMDNYFETPGINPETNPTAIGFPGTQGSDGGGNVVNGGNVFGEALYMYEGRANYWWGLGTENHEWWKSYPSGVQGNNESVGDYGYGDLQNQPFYNSIYQSVEPFPSENVGIGNMMGKENWCTPFGNSDNVAANMKQLRGLPSRAIRNSTWTDPASGTSTPSSYMDFSTLLDFPNSAEGSVVGRIADLLGQAWYAGGNGWGANEGYTWQKKWAFASKLITPGTKFRFQNDPDSIIYTTHDYTDTTEGYSNDFFWKPGTTRNSGAFGIRNFRPARNAYSFVEIGGGIWSGEGASQFEDMGSPFGQFLGNCTRQRWSIVVTPRIGGGPSGYNPMTGTKPPEQGGPTYTDTDYRRALHHDGTSSDVIEIVSSYNEDGSTFTPNAAVFETLPREAADLDIYYQASPIMPLTLTSETNEELLPLGTTFKWAAAVGNTVGIGDTSTASGGSLIGDIITSTTHTITAWDDADTIRFTPALPDSASGLNSMNSMTPSVIKFTRPDGYQINSKLKVNVASSGSTVTMKLAGGVEQVGVTAPANSKIHAQRHFLNWSNCWVFGNGVESDRIRDDYNSAQMDNGVKASSTITQRVKEERRKHGVIWSGIYNSTSGINNTNQFIMAEKVTKDLNPIYGSIQKLYNRNTQLIMFCEDKVLQAVTNRDLLYKADGSKDVVASDTTVGSATPYQGDYGIAQNPESFAATPSTIYFTDSIRGKVLALHNNGVKPISDKGMKDYFADLCAENVWKAIGSYDERKNEYNLSILKKYYPSQVNYTGTTISFSELADGWVSFKSFIPQGGLSINNKYFTFSNGHIWQHYSNATHNHFYEKQYTSDITLLMNDTPEVVKSFGSINYEGSQGKITAFTDVDSVNMLSGIHGTNSGITSTDDVSDGEFFNLTAQAGWYVDNIATDQQSTGNIEFKEKEGKWFGHPSGETTSLANLDEKEFTVQGLGNASINHSDSTLGDQITITVTNNTSTTTETGFGTWDEIAD